MKKIMIIAFVIFANAVSAQDTVKTASKINEFSLTLNNISPIIKGSMFYKRQIGAKTFLKIGFIDLSVTNQTDENYDGHFKRNELAYSAGLSIGLEFRVKINNRVSFCHGPNLTYSYYNSRIENIDPFLSTKIESRQSNSFSTPYNFGFLFKITNHFLIGLQGTSSIGVEFAETNYSPLPSPYAPHGKSTNFDFSINKNSGFLYFTYRF